MMDSARVVTMATQVKKNDSKVLLDKTSCKRGFSQYLAVWLWVGWTNFYFTFFFSIPLLYLYCKPLLGLIFFFIILSAMSPIDRKKQPKWAFALGEWIMKRAAEYFHMKVIAEDLDALEKTGTAIFALEPHDILPLSIFAFNDCLKGFKGHSCMGCLTSACFKVPLMRHLYTWVNATSIDKKNLIRMINQNISPVICPGGVQEVTMMEKEDECVLFLKSRFGFVKLALQHGLALIPVFSFGLNKSFDYVKPHPFLIALSRKIGFVPMMFFGMWNTPLGPSKPCDYTNVIGVPIAVPKIENPTDEDIKKYHAIYITELTRIYETHKADYGMENIQLRII